MHVDSATGLTPMDVEHAAAALAAQPPAASGRPTASPAELRGNGGEGGASSAAGVCAAGAKPA